MDNKSATLELGTKPVGSLLMQYAIPAIVAMVASSLYNMVDSIFIGQGVGPMAISGLAITFPFTNLSGAMGACIGVGASISVGEIRTERLLHGPAYSGELCCLEDHHRYHLRCHLSTVPGSYSPVLWRIRQHTALCP